MLEGQKQAASIGQPSVQPMALRTYAILIICCIVLKKSSPN